MLGQIAIARPDGVGRNRSLDEGPIGNRAKLRTMAHKGIGL